MGRDIKFRVFNKELNTMMLGVNQYGIDEPDSGIKTSSAGAFTRLWESLARINEDDNYILMQFTGLQDVNGVDIYEGDIVDDLLIGVCEVKYNETYGAFKVLHKNKRTAKWFIDYLPNEFKYLTVIGNIHENPELLK